MEPSQPRDTPRPQFISDLLSGADLAETLRLLITGGESCTDFVELLEVLTTIGDEVNIVWSYDADSNVMLMAVTSELAATRRRCTGQTAASREPGSLFPCSRTRSTW